MLIPLNIQTSYNNKNTKEQENEKIKQKNRENGLKEKNNLKLKYILQ